jgi:hypothetical protein
VQAGAELRQQRRHAIEGHGLCTRRGPTYLHRPLPCRGGALTAGVVST